ncbi:hypothetical protein [Rhodoplanes sp. Z2-YC6860]|uniref:hypothetical protein n=1 Tax=Rhodoplanes sp. Z2-YC6860 TaxID=674703 RepID=UPI003FA72529
MQRELGSPEGFVVHGRSNRESKRSGRILIGKQASLAEEPGRELAASEASTDQFAAIHAPAAIKSCELIGKGRLGKLCQANPVNIVLRVETTRIASAIKRLLLTQHALTSEMVDELAMQHLTLSGYAPNS